MRAPAAGLPCRRRTPTSPLRRPPACRQDGQAQRTKATTPLIKDARRALLLSGTPALNKPKEIFQQAGWVT